jgi:hypothetical protein
MMPDLADLRKRKKNLHTHKKAAQAGIKIG